jgi:hypothetical protein
MTQRIDGLGPMARADKVERQATKLGGILRSPRFTEPLFSASLVSFRRRACASEH